MYTQISLRLRWVSISSSKRQLARPTPQASGFNQDRPDVPITNLQQQGPTDPSVLPPPLPPGPDGPLLTNDRIISQILRPASLPSPGQIGSIQPNFHSPADHRQGSSHDSYPSPSMDASFGINTQGPFSQPNLANLAGPTPHPSMEMLLQAVSTTQWSGPSVTPGQPLETYTSLFQGDMNALTPAPPSSQVPTGYINLGLPPDPLPFAQMGQAYTSEEGIADVFGWGVDSADWMQLYDSMGTDSNLVAPADLAQMSQSHTQPQTIFTPQHPMFMQNVTTAPSVWMTSQILHSNSATPPSSINDHPRYASLSADRAFHARGRLNSHDQLGSADYSIPGELPDNHEAYPSRTSRINRDIKFVSEAQHGGEAVGHGMIPGRRTRHATEDLPHVLNGEQRVSFRPSTFWV